MRVGAPHLSALYFGPRNSDLVIRTSYLAHCRSSILLLAFPIWPFPFHSHCGFAQEKICYVSLTGERHPRQTYLKPWGPLCRWGRNCREQCSAPRFAAFPGECCNARVSGHRTCATASERTMPDQPRYWRRACERAKLASVPGEKRKLYQRARRLMQRRLIELAAAGGDAKDEAAAIESALREIWAAEQLTQKPKHYCRLAS